MLARRVPGSYYCFGIPLAPTFRRDEQTLQTRKVGGGGGGGGGAVDSLLLLLASPLLFLSLSRTKTTTSEDRIVIGMGK